MQGIDQLFHMIYPSKCILCRRILISEHKTYYCPLCYDKFRAERMTYLKWLGKDYLGTRQAIGQEQIAATKDVVAVGELYEAEALMQTRPVMVMALFTYTAEYRKAIMRWKYTGIRKYAKGFAHLLVEYTDFFNIIKVDGIVPVPLAKKRMRRRGFNQAKDFAKALGEEVKVPVWDLLERIRETKPQTSCQKEERFQNIRGAIKLKDKINLSPINSLVIVDDIYTTGSTIRECIKALKQYELFKDTCIYVIVVAKGDF